MRINHSTGLSAGLNANFKNQRARSQTLKKLSTGLRINASSDDAAGLAISENLRTQVRGSSQARRNSLDGISMLNIAEGALNEVHSLLQRGRELSVQSASETLTDSERVYIQKEVSNIIEEVDRISGATTFNGKEVLNGGVSASDAADITKGLKDFWLDEAEKLVNAQYGLSAEGAEALDIKLESGGVGGVAAYVSYNYGPDGKATNMSLNIDVDDFTPVVTPDGGTAPMYADRIIAHEMVHAIMASTMDTRTLPTWFKEGAAELIHGADERVTSDLAANGNNAQALVDMIAGGGWAGDSAHYSGAYLAARFLDNSAAGGMAAVMASLEGAANGDLDTAIGATTAFANTAAFLTAFQATGAAYGGYGVDLSDADTGAIGGGNATSVVPNNINNTDDPLNDFTENWDSTGEPSILHIGANDETSDQLELIYGSVNATSIGIDSIDIGTASGGQAAIGQFDEAIKSVSTVRSDIGSYVNRLEHTVNNLINSETNQQAAESQIRDADFAKESADLTRQQILSQSSMSMIAQAGTQRQSILSLIQ